MNVELTMNAVLPEKNRKARSTKYPIDKMLPGHSFFVPGDEAYKQLCSQASGANARYAVPHPEAKTRKNNKGETVTATVRTRVFEVRLSVDPVGAHLLRVK
jgi:hypothetical protein